MRRAPREMTVRSSVDRSYVVLGFVLVVTLVNTLATLLLYVRVERSLGQSVVARRFQPPVGSTEPLTSMPSELSSSSTVEAKHVWPSAPPLDGDDSGAKEPEHSVGESSRELSDVIDVPPPRVELTPIPLVSAAAEPVTEGALIEAVAQEETKEERFPTLTSGDEPPEGSPAVVFGDEAPMFRLSLLDEVRGPLHWRLSFLLDQDSRVRRRALECIRDYSSLKRANEEAGSESSQRIIRMLIAAAKVGDESIKAILVELALLFPEAVEVAGELSDPETSPDVDRERLNEDLREVSSTIRAERRMASLSEALRTVEREGLDLVVVLDISRSMGRVFDGVRRELEWLWPALQWGVPGIQLAIALYRDEIEGFTDFGVEVSDQIERLRSVKASGGGDVPEGVHRAVKKTLSLGIFRWRERAIKHVIVLGDAPPPYGEQRGLLAVVARAREQAGFHVHALTLTPELEGKAVTFFELLAKAGGGRAATITPEQIGKVVLASLLDVGQSRSGDDFAPLAQRIRAAMRPSDNSR